MSRFIKHIIKSTKFRWASLIVTIGMFIAFWFCLPEPLFNDPTSTVIDDKAGRLLSAKIADDGQWRFPLNPEVPEKFKTCIVSFEDRYFYSHPGVNIFSLGRALFLNLKEGEIISGGSTLSMQVIRLSRKGKSRTIKEKIIEIVLALRLEMRYSKSEILALYAAHAPFGGNVVGLETASWRYFSRPANQLSWAETATLAVLPNAPSLIYPGKNQQHLFEKRNRLLKKLNNEEILSKIDLELAVAEPIPVKPARLNQRAPHLLTQILKDKPGKRIQTTIDLAMQDEVTDLVNKHQQVYSHNKIYNVAALVVESETGEVKAWVGNATNTEKAHGCEVDMIQARRSTGSILKPVLFAAMLDDGLILPNTLIPDVPTQIGSFMPMNFDKNYAGAVPAQKALYQSLNVPAVKMLQDYGVPRFRNKLMEIGMNSLDKSAEHYGLSLILGGAEVSMFELATIYTSMSRSLNHFYNLSSIYDQYDWRTPHFIFSDTIKPDQHVLEKKGPLSAASIWFTFDAMRKVNRPDELAGWESFASSEKVAWKTGTSFGFRDAWAVGVTPEYVVVVWVGNADGEGRPGLTGVSCAAPVLFDIFNFLPQSGWYGIPYDELSKAAICKESGHRAGQYCEDPDTVLVPISGLKTATCRYHHLIHLDPTGKYQVTDVCYDPAEMIHRSWFVLPPVMEWYFRKNNPLYQQLPPMITQCSPTVNIPMEFVYPGSGNRMYIPVNLAGKSESIILEAAHANEQATIFWHLDDAFLGETIGNHKMEIHPKPGWHNLVIVDNHGNTVRKRIEILNGDLASSRN